MINRKNVDDDKLYEAITGLLIRVSALKRTLIEKGTISKDEYLQYLNGSVEELQGIMTAAIAATAERQPQKKILS